MNTHKQQRSRSNGFTLIEILVVIAIISILAAILFPVFARARESARRASCLSNLKQIALGMMMYVQDYDGRFPYGYPLNAAYDPSTDTNSSRPSGVFMTHGYGDITGIAHYRTWMDLIFPYVKSTQLFVCPSARSDERSPSYGYNAAFGGMGSDRYWFTHDTTHYWEPLSQAEITRPSEVIMLMDNNRQLAPRTFPRNMNEALSTAHTRVMPHLEGGNRAFADGHVKWWPKQRVYHVYSDNTACTPNNPQTSTSSNSSGYINNCDPAWNPWVG